MASRKVDINIKTTADTSGATKASTAMSGLQKSAGQAETGAKAAGKGVASVGTIASQAGFQVQDFAVQVAGGTSALTAMAQQAPQFLGVFGPGGAIAGALIAVGAIAAKVFLGMGEDAATAAEKAAKLADQFDESTERAKKLQDEKIDFGLQQMADAAAQAEALIGVLNRVKTAQEAANLTAAQNAETLRKAETEIARLLGKRIDESKEILDAANAESEARRIAAQNAINEKQRELEVATQRKANTQASLEGSLQRREASKQEKADLEAQLNQLRAYRAELQAVAEQTQTLTTTGIMAPPTAVTVKTPAAMQAQARLEDPGAVKRIERLEELIANVTEKLKPGGALDAAVSQSTNAVELASKDVEAIQGTIEAQIPEIQQSFQTQEIVGQIEAIKEVATQAATEVQAIIDQVKPQNEKEKAALESLKTDVSDRKITADESARVAQALGTLDGNIRKTMGDQLTNVNKLIQTVSGMERKLQQQQTLIDNLQRNTNRGSGR